MRSRRCRRAQTVAGRVGRYLPCALRFGHSEAAKSPYFAQKTRSDASRMQKNEDFAPFLISQSASHFDCMSLAIGGKIDLQLRQEDQKAVAFCGFLISQNAPLILT